MAGTDEPVIPGAELEVTVTAVEVEMPSLATRVEWYEDAEEATVENNIECRRERDYYDNIQWTDEEVAVLDERGQPVITKNKIAKKIDYMLGEEIKRRVDPVAKPRNMNNQQQENSARAATDALRYVEEEQNTDKVLSAVAKNVAIEGTGGCLKGVEYCGCDDYGNKLYKHILTHIEWDRLFWDPRSRTPDTSDAKYKGLVVWMDMDDAIIDFPDATDALKAAMNSSSPESSDKTDDTPRNWIDRKRQRIKIIEMYFRVGKNWYRSIFTKGADIVPPEPTFLKDEKKQYSVCPLVIVSHRVDRNGNRYGMVRAMMSPQDEINKRASKSLHLLSTRQVIAERDTIIDPTKFQTELAKADGYAEVEPGTFAAQRIQITQTGDLAQGHVAMMQEAKQDIDSIGPTSSMIPDLPQSASGRAVLARKSTAQQEGLSTFDHLDDARLEITKLDWYCIRQYWTEEMWLRVTDDNELNGYRFVAINRKMTRAQRLQELMQDEKRQLPLPKAVELAAGNDAPVIMSMVQRQHQAMVQQAQMTGQPPPQGDEHMMQMVLQNPLMQEVITENQVEKMQMDIVLDTAPETAVLAQEQFDTISEILPVALQARPDMAPLLVKLLFKSSSLPDKKEILEFLEKGPDPQEQQKQQQMQAMQMEQIKSGIQVAQSQAQLNQARASESSAKAQTEMPKAQSTVQKNLADAESKRSDQAIQNAQAGAMFGLP